MISSVKESKEFNDKEGGKISIQNAEMRSGFKTIDQAMLRKLVNAQGLDSMSLCTNCKNWECSDSVMVDDKKLKLIGECRFNPPCATAGFPKTSAFEWCAKFEPKVIHAQ